MRTALDLLKKDHKQVKKLLKELVETTTRAKKRRAELLDEIETELEVHTTIEEEIFYPALRDAATRNEQREVIAEAFEEHRAVNGMVLPDLKKTKVDTVEFGGRAKVLKELVEHHADEEEDEMFSLAHELMSEEELHELGEQMMGRKQQLLRKLRAA